MSNRRGFVLVTTYLFVAMLATWVAIGYQRAATELNATKRYVESLQAFHIAEGGLDDAQDWMRRQPSPPAGVNPFDPFNGPRSLHRGQYRAAIDPDDANPGRFRDVFTIDVTGEVNGTPVTRRIVKILQADSFARYSYFTDSERLGPPSNSPIWFTSRDYFEGPVHSNDQLNIAGSPIFNGPVSSSAASVNYRNPPPAGGNNPQFQGELTLGASPVTLPLSATKLRLNAQSGGAWLSGNTTIVFQADGTMRVTNPARGWVNRPQPLPANGAIFVNGGDVIVFGTLDGQVSVGTNRDIVIADNLRYADNPRTNPRSNDVLGLVAEKNVIVAQSAPYDLEVQASVMALESSFTVQNWSQGPPKGTLSVYGGIIQDRRGPVGTFNATTGQKRSGYSKDYRYDGRLADLAPPFYPTISDYQEVLWYEP